MMRTLFLFFTLPMLRPACAQADALTMLTGANGQQWTVIGSSDQAGGACKEGDATYTFSAKDVVVKKCTGGTWKSRTEALATWAAGGKNGVAFGGEKYEVKQLPASAPACKGHGHCVRLATMPDGKTDATRTIYLWH